MWRSALPARQLNLESGATETAEAVAASGLPCHDVGTGAIEKFRAARRTQAIVKTTDQDGHTRPAAAAVPPDRRSSARDRLSPRRTPVAAVVAGPRPRRSESAAGPPGREDEDQARPRRSDLWPAEGDPRNAPERPAGEPAALRPTRSATRSGRRVGRSKPRGGWPAAERRSSICTFMTCGGKPAHDGSRAACRCRWCAIGSATRTSARPARTSNQRSWGSTTPCGGSRRREAAPHARQRCERNNGPRKGLCNGVKRKAGNSRTRVPPERVN